MADTFSWEQSKQAEPTSSSFSWEKQPAKTAPSFSWEKEDDEERKPGITWERTKKAPVSAALSPFVGAIDFIAGAPAFLASIPATVGAYAGSGDWDKSYATGQKVGDFLFGSLSGIGTKTARKLGADPIVGEAAEPLNQAMEAGANKLSESTGMPKGAAHFIMDVGTLVLGEGIAKTAKKTGLTDKMTASTEEGRAKFREELDKKSADFQEAQERKAKEPPKESKPTEAKETVDPETGEIKPVKEEPPKEKTAAESIMTPEQQAGFEDGMKKFNDLIDRFKKKYDDLTEIKLSEKDKAEYSEKRAKIDEQFRKESVHLSEEQILNKALRETKVLEDFAKVRALDPMKDKSLYRAWAEDVKDTIGMTVRRHVANALEAAFDYHNMVDIAPNKQMREQVWEAFQRGTTDQLEGKAKDLADFYRARMEEFGKRALDAETVKGLIEDYASRIVDMSHLTPEQRSAVLNKLREYTGPSAPTTSKFGKSRTTLDFDSFLKALDDNGLKLKTTDLAEVYKEYASSMNKAIENSNLIKKLKTIEIKGDPIFIPISEDMPAYSNYKKLVGKGVHENYLVHPDIYPSLKHVIDAQDPHMLVRAVSTLTSAIKRLNIGFSFFHGSSLTVASALANAPKDVLTNGAELAKNFKDGMLRDKQTGRLKPEVRQWVEEGGLMFGISEDAGVGAYTQMAKNVDSLIGKLTGTNFEMAEKALKPGSRVQDALDHATWTLLHDGLKYLTAEKYLEKARIDHPEVPDSVHRQEISRAVNNIYGGLDWFDVGRNTWSKFENTAMHMTSPEGRRSMQLLMFAPDWTLSTVKAFTSALPKEILKPATWDIAQGIAGLTKPLTAADYARRYQMRYAMYSLLLANGVNLALSGHYIWDNKDPTTIDLGDGRSMAWAKHPSEPLHWIFNFQKTFYNKLGWSPKEIAEGVEYAKGKQTAKEYYTGMAKRASPFTVTTILDPKADISAAVSGFMGLPIRGKKNQEIQDRLDRAKRNIQRKLGVKIIEPEQSEDEE